MQSPFGIPRGGASVGHCIYEMSHRLNAYRRESV